MKNAFKELLEFQALNPQISDDEQLIEDFLQQSGIIPHTIWDKEDIRILAEEDNVDLTEDEVNRVAMLMARKSDANEGINYDVIRCWIDMVKNAY